MFQSLSWSRVLQSVALVVLSLFCYLTVIDAPFVWDDEVMVVENPFIRNSTTLGSVLTSSAFGEPLSTGKFYRPVQILSYRLNYYVSGLSPSAFRWTSVLVHAVTVVVFFRILLLLGLSSVLGWITAALFAVHPLNIESVTYIAGRGDVLSVFFGMLTLLCIVKARKHWGYVVSGLLFFVLSFLSKENAVFLAGVSIIYPLLMLDKAQINRKNVVLAVSALVLALTFSLWRLGFLGASLATHQALSQIAFASAWERFLTLPYCLYMYVRWVFVPYPLHMEYHFVQRVWTWDILVYVGTVLGVWSFLFYVGSAWRRTLFFFLFWVGSLVPFLHVASPLASTVREHWGQWALLALLIPISEWVMVRYSALSTPSLKGGARAAVLLVVCSLMGVTIHRNQDWKDPERLYLHDLRLEPKSFLLHNNYGVIAYRKGDKEAAFTAFKRAVSESPDQGYSVGHNNLGAIYLEQKNLARAEFHFLESVKQGRYLLAYINLGQLYLKHGHLHEAELIIQEGLSYYPYDVSLNALLHRVQSSQ